MLPQKARRNFLWKREGRPRGGGTASSRQGDGRPWAHSQQICFFVSSYCSASNRHSFTLFARERGFTAIAVLLVFFLLHQVIIVVTSSNS
jgi:hypothetical protein